MKSIIKPGLVLAIYMTAACVGLALVYTGTKPLIESRQTRITDTLREIFPTGDRFEEISDAVPSRDSNVVFEYQYAVYSGPNIAGAVVRARAQGYAGPIAVLTGVGIDGRISGVRILEISETPGFGANAASPTYYVNQAEQITFYGQFSGKTISDPFEPRNDVIAVSSSTITSRAIASIVKASGQAAGEWLRNHQGGLK